jgi:hypothetical protein
MGHPWKIKKIEKAFNDLLDTCSGGANEKFVPFMFLVMEMDRKAGDGDMDALRVVDPLFQINRLIDVAVKLDRDSRRKKDKT